MMEEMLEEILHKLRVLAVSAAVMYAGHAAKNAAWQYTGTWPAKIGFIALTVLLSAIMIAYSFYLIWIEEGSCDLCPWMHDKACASFLMGVYSIVLLFIRTAYTSILMKIFCAILIIILIRNTPLILIPCEIVSGVLGTCRNFGQNNDKKDQKDQK